MDSQTQPAAGPPANQPIATDQVLQRLGELQRHSQLALPPPGRARVIDRLRRAWAWLWGQDWIEPALRQQQHFNNLAAQMMAEAVQPLLVANLDTARQLGLCSARLDEQGRRLDTYFTWLDEQSRRLDTYLAWLEQHGRLQEADHAHLAEEASLGQAMRAGYAATRLEIDDIAGEVRRLQTELGRLAAGRGAPAERGDDGEPSIPR